VVNGGGYHTLIIIADRGVGLGLTDDSSYRGDWGNICSNKIINIENATNYINSRLDNILTINGSLILNNKIPYSEYKTYSLTNVYSISNLPIELQSGYLYKDLNGNIKKYTDFGNYELNLIYNNTKMLSDISVYLDNIIPDYLNNVKIKIKFIPGIYTNSIQPHTGLIINGKTGRGSIYITSLSDEVITNYNDNPSTQSVIIVQNTTTSWFTSIHLVNLSIPVFINNIKFCINTNYGTGIVLDSANNVTIDNCSFIGVSSYTNRASDFGNSYGIRMYGNSYINNSRWYRDYSSMPRSGFYSCRRNFFDNLWIAYLSWCGNRVVSYADVITNTYSAFWNASLGGIIQVIYTNSIQNNISDADFGGIVIGPEGLSAGF